MRLFMTTLLLAGSSALSAQQPQQFDLLCSGTMTAKGVSIDRTEPYASRYRIDLAAMKWCEAECRALFDISSVQPTSIGLQDKAVDTPSEESLTVNRIDRETGDHRIIATSRRRGDPLSILSLDWRGRCEPAPFSGFPTFETLF